MKPQTYLNALKQSQVCARGGYMLEYGPYADRAERGLRAALARQDAEVAALRERVAELEAQILRNALPLRWLFGEVQ
jgi:hypothetical protein